VCLGAGAAAANENARRRYKYENERRERQWMQTISIYNAKKVKYNEDVQNANLAKAQSKVRQQEGMDRARGEAQLKYQELFNNLLKDTKYGKLAASGQTGQSLNRLATMEYAKYGRDVSEIARRLTLNDRELALRSSAEISKFKQMQDQAFANVAFQPIETVAPPQPVMQNVGAQAFMQALSIAASVATAGGSGGFNWWGPEAGSDRRLKENIKKIGESISGLGIYTFNYIGHATKYIGTMADEVLKVKPEAVTVRDGYLAVYYDMIDVNLEIVK
tara:strand:+ start:1315 stop:2139 length:825 start_codon:yes stop_codon:yes gene_type:complete